MSRRRALAVITVAVGALLGALGVSSASAAPPAGTDASEVTHWNQVAATTLGAVPGPNGGAPPAFQINMGMVQGAVYDAVNAIGPKQHQPYLLNRRTGAKASIDAAVATAAYDVLSELVSTAPERAPFPGRAGLLSTLSTAYAASLDAIDDDSFKKQGIAVGHAAAEAMLDAREGDGRFGPSRGCRTPRPDTGSRCSSAAGAPILDPTPWVGNVKPFLIQSSSQFRSAPPPALDSAQWATEFNEVKSLGRATSSTRTDDQTYIAKWWQSAPVLSWNEVARQLIARTGLDAADSAQAPRAAEPERRGRGDQLLERQVPLRLLAAVERDSTSGGGRQPRDGRRRRPGRRSSPRRIPSGSRDTTASTRAHVAVLRMFFGDDPAGGPSRSRARPRSSNPRRTGGAHVRHVLAATRRAHRGTHLGRPALPQRRRGGPGARPERGQLRRPRTTSSR